MGHLTAAQDIEQMLETLRRTGIECAQKANSIPHVYSHGSVDEGDKLDVEDAHNQGHPEAAP
jgi:hypothetical protein